MAQIHDPVARVGVQIYLAVLLGIAFVMTIKPTLLWSIVAILVATALGLLSGLPLLRAARQPAS